MLDQVISIARSQPEKLLVEAVGLVALVALILAALLVPGFA